MANLKSPETRPNLATGALLLLAAFDASLSLPLIAEAASSMLQCEYGRASHVDFKRISVSSGWTYAYGRDITASPDGGKTWCKTNFSLRSTDPTVQEPAIVEVVNAVTGKNGMAFFLVTNSASRSYRDTKSGAGFLDKPDLMEIEGTAAGNTLRRITNFEGVGIEGNNSILVKVANSSK